MKNRLALIGILDDEVIAEKTGLTIQEVKKCCIILQNELASSSLCSSQRPP